MAVQVDEPGRHDMASDVELVRGWPERVADLGDPAAGDRDVGNLVAGRFRVDDAAAAQDDVVHDPDPTGAPLR